MTTTQPTKEDRSTALSHLGFMIVVNSGPLGKVSDKQWPHIAYSVTLSYKGKPVLSTDYSLGVGNVDPKKFRSGSMAIGFTQDEAKLIEAWASNPRAAFKDKELWAWAAAKLAMKQKISPALPDVLHSLMTDGESFFNAQSFEQWASEFGYDKDSRAAEAIYKTCDDIGRKMAAGIPAEVLDQVREILQNY